VYNVRFLNEAVDDLSSLDKLASKRILDKIMWIQENIDNIQPEELSGKMAGFYKLRVGSYRVIYEILKDEKIILIHAVGHRSKIYKKL